MLWRHWWESNMVTFEDLKTGKVKLEFGNIEQIKVIRTHEKMVEYQKTMCVECGGEGTITIECPRCDGSGKKNNKD